LPSITKYRRSIAGACCRNSISTGAGEITPCDAFCDVVFGFALTLLVVSLEVVYFEAQELGAAQVFIEVITALHSDVLAISRQPSPSA
jgi:hypothetical protein